MGGFLGFTGSFLILAAAAGVIMRFFSETGNVSKKRIADISYSLALSAASGFIYLAVLAFIKTCLYGAVNISDAAALFDCGEIREGLLGRIMLGDFGTAAAVVSFGGAWAFVYFTMLAAERALGADISRAACIFAVFFPYAFMLFSPSYISLICAAAMLFVYILLRLLKAKPRRARLCAPACIFIFASEFLASAFFIYRFAAGL